MATITAVNSTADVTLSGTTVDIVNLGKWPFYRVHNKTGTTTLSVTNTTTDPTSLAAETFSVAPGETIVLPSSNASFRVLGNGNVYRISGAMTADASTKPGATSALGAQAVAGDVASDTADSGNPVKIGGLYDTTPPTLTDGDRGDALIDVNGRLIVTLGTLQAGEDQTVNVTMVENRFSSSRKTADGQVKASAGFVHAVTITPTTATPTAGLMTVYDSLTETGTILFSKWFIITEPGATFPINQIAATGIYVGYDAALANASVTVSFR